MESFAKSEQSAHAPTEGGLFAPPTYRDLETAVAGLSRKDIAMLLSTLRQWRLAFDYDQDSLLGPEFTSEYPDHVVAFRAVRARGGAQERTICSDSSRMTAIKTTAANLLDNASLPGGSFSEVLGAAILLRGMSWKEAADHVGSRANGKNHAQVVRKWVVFRSHPTAPHLRAGVAKLEAALRLPAGTLVSRLPGVPVNSRFSPERTRLLRTPFGARIQEELTRLNWTAGELSRRSGVSTPIKIYAWMKPGAHNPGVQRRESVPRLEEALGLRAGELFALLPPIHISHQPYAIRPNLAQQAEWDAYVAYKTDREQSDDARRPLNFWRIREDGRIPSARMYLQQWLQYGGWMTMHSAAASTATLEENPGEFGLADYARPAEVEAFIRWRARRVSGVPKYTMGHHDLLMGITSLLRPGSGYLWQGHNVDLNAVARRGILRGANGAAPTREEWREHCAMAFATIDRLRKHLKNAGMIVKPKSYEHIKDILSAPRPMDLLQRLVTNMRADLHRYNVLAERTGAVKLAQFRRDLLLFELLAATALRIEHWTRLEYRDDNTGHLRRKADGTFELRISKEDFKRVAAFRDHDYEADLPPRLTPLIEIYLQTDRPHLVGADRCDYVFRPSRLTRFAPWKLRRGDPEAGPFVSLDARIKAWSAVYLADVVERGFGPHAIRHIIATHLVKVHPVDGKIRAADVLHNTPRMIERSYGHLTSQDRTKRALSLVEAEYAAAVPA